MGVLQGHDEVMPVYLGLPGRQQLDRTQSVPLNSKLTLLVTGTYVKSPL
jgi:hypothetical protein